MKHKKIIWRILFIVISPFVCVYLFSHYNYFSKLHTKETMEKLAKKGDVEAMIQLMKKNRYIKYASIDFMIIAISQNKYDKTYLPFLKEVIRNSKNTRSCRTAERALSRIESNSSNFPAQKSN